MIHILQVQHENLETSLRKLLASFSFGPIREVYKLPVKSKGAAVSSDAA
jgi:hypothetical protein